MRPLYYKLDDVGRISPCDMFEANKQLSSLSGRCVCCEKVAEGVTVSTAFLVFDHAPFGPEPVLWNTCVYYADGSYRIAAKYTTLERARQGHREVVALIKLLI